MRFPRYKWVLALGDYALLVGAFLLALKLRFQFDIDLFRVDGGMLVAPVVGFFLGYALFWVVLFQQFNLYKINVFLTRAEQVMALFKVITYGILGLALLSFFTKASWIVNSRLTIAMFGVISLLALGTWRIVLFGPLFRFLAHNNIYKRLVLIVGAGKAGQLMAANIVVDRSLGLQLVGFLDDHVPAGTAAFEQYRVLGKIDEIEAIAPAYGIHEVIVTIGNTSYERMVQILDECRATKRTVRVASSLFDIIPEKVFAEKYAGVPVVGVNRSSDRMHRVYKRVFDTAVASLALLAFSPVFLAVALAVKLTSPGPIFFKQTRIGRDGKPFPFFKFRSMFVNNDASAHEAYVKKLIRNELSKDAGPLKIMNDPRVTPVGRLLRKTSLDELPQILNVLRGEMSLVGPRPCLPYEWDLYEPWHRRRLAVTPGCTGLWQVSGRSAVTFNDMVILDLYYIDNMSPVFDLQLMLKTIPVMLFAKGAH